MKRIETQEKLFFGKLFMSGRIVLALLTIILICGGCFRGTSTKYINEIRNAPEKNLTRSAIFRIFENGKRSIPLLIELIPENSYFSYHLKNPDNPKKYEFFENIGFAYAYLVELILGREKLEFDDDADDFLGSKKNYVYWDGEIAHREAWKTKVIDASTLFEIQYWYRRWWKDNKHKSLRQLRAEWKKGNRPLSATNYCWK